LVVVHGLARSDNKSVLEKFCFPSLLVHAVWFASKLAVAAFVLTHNGKLITIVTVSNPAVAARLGPERPAYRRPPGFSAVCRLQSALGLRPRRALRAYCQAGPLLDVCFREDQSRARAGYAAENLATLRRLALNLLKREKTKKRGVKGKQLNTSWNHVYLLQLLGI
jgi:hypothetical protein